MKSQVIKFLPILLFTALFFFYFYPVLFNLNTKMLGPFGDKAGTLITLSSNRFGFLHQPVMRVYFWLTSHFFNPVVSYNIGILTSFPLTFIFSYLFFKRFFNPFLTGALAVVFTFSPYHIMHSYNHIDLAQIWVFPLFFTALISFFQEPERIKSIKMGAVMALTVLVSNYYGYFLVLIYVLAVVIYFLLQRKVQAREAGLNLKLIIVPPLVSFSIALLFLLPFLYQWYFKTDSSLYFINLTPNRGVADFVTFSARPWYYLLPSVYHPVLGSCAERVYGWLNSTGHYLLDDFFAQEHAGIYLGWANLLLGGFAIYKLFRSAKRVEQLVARNSSHLRPDCGKTSVKILIALLILLAALFLLSMPPFITVFGLKIYLPSFILMKVFPMFRTLSRLGAPILLLLLVFVGVGLQWICGCLPWLSSRRRTRRSYILIMIYLLVALFEFYNPPKIVDIPPYGSVEYQELLEEKNIWKRSNY